MNPSVNSCKDRFPTRRTKTNGHRAKTSSLRSSQGVLLNRANLKNSICTSKKWSISQIWKKQSIRFTRTLTRGRRRRKREINVNLLRARPKSNSMRLNRHSALIRHCFHPRYRSKRKMKCLTKRPSYQPIMGLLLKQSSISSSSWAPAIYPSSNSNFPRHSVGPQLKNVSLSHHPKINRK